MPLAVAEAIKTFEAILEAKGYPPPAPFNDRAILTLICDADWKIEPAHSARTPRPAILEGRPFTLDTLGGTPASGKSLEASASWSTISPEGTTVPVGTTEPAYDLSRPLSRGKSLGRNDRPARERSRERRSAP